MIADDLGMHRADVFNLGRLRLFNGFQGHAAFGTGFGAGLPYFGVHGTGVLDRPRSMSRRRHTAGKAVRIREKLLPAMSAAKVNRRSIVYFGRSGFCRIDGHAADGIGCFWRILGLGMEVVHCSISVSWIGS